MKVRLNTVVLAFLLGAGMAAPAQGQCVKEACQSIHDDFWESNLWPYPYVCPDRLAVPEPFCVMVQNGWRRQNLVAEHHFQNKSELSASGERLIRWIMTEAPIQHRTIYVRRGDTPDETAARVGAVQQYAAKIATDGNVPPILETNIKPASRPADWPNPKDSTISRKFPIAVPNNIFLPYGNPKKD